MSEPRSTPDPLPEEPGSTLAHVRGAQSSDEISWANLFGKIRETAEQHCADASLPSGCEMEDLVNEVSLQVARDLCSFDATPGSSFRAWLRTIAEHKLIDLKRRAAAARRGGGMLLGRDSAVANVPAPAADRQSVHARRNELQERLRQVLAEMQENHRQVIELRLFRGFSHAEIAPILGFRREVTARSLFKRARDVLQEKLSRFGEA